MTPLSDSRSAARASRCSHSRQISGLLVALGLALQAVGHGATAALDPTAPPNLATGGHAAPAPNALGDDELILPEIFTSHLPATMEKYGFRFSVHPHLDDLKNKDHLRLSTTLRYGLTENFEISAGSDLYSSHGQGDIRAFHDYGAANLELGGKLNLGQLLFPRWETGVGFDYTFPIGRPPAELTDGLRHLRPYVTFSHRLDSHPTVRIFADFRWDDVTKTARPGTFGRNAFRNDSTGITSGWVVDQGNLHYTFEAAVDSTRLLGRTGKDVYTLRPGVLWEIPSRRNRLARSHWIVGIALTDAYGPDGNNTGVSLKLRYSRDIKVGHHPLPDSTHD